MNQVTLQVYSIQKTIDPEFIEHLETFVEEHGYCLKTVSLINDAIENPNKTFSNQSIDELTEWQKKLEAFREKIGPVKSDSALDIRELRDSR